MEETTEPRKDWLVRHPDRTTSVHTYAELKEMFGTRLRRAKVDGTIVFVGIARPAR